MLSLEDIGAPRRGCELERMLMRRHSCDGALSRQGASELSRSLDPGPQPGVREHQSSKRMTWRTASPFASLSRASLMSSSLIRPEMSSSTGRVPSLHSFS